MDKSDLEAKVAEINGTLSPADYTSETWEALQDELLLAQGTLTNGNATQSEVDQALNDLIAKVAALRTPAPTTVTLIQSETDGNQLVLLFDQEIELTDLTDFTVTVDDVVVTPSGWSIDPSDQKKLVLTLPPATDVADKTVKVKYDGNGNLASVDHVPVVNFERTALDPFASALRIMTPSAATVSVPRPAIAGTAEAGSTVTVVIKDGAGYELSTVVTADTDGRWSFTPREDLADGGYTIEATATKGDQSFTVSKPLVVDTTERPGLSTLQLNSWNGTPVGMTPGFSSDTYKYSASVTNSVYGVTLESLALYPGATIQVSVNGGTPQTVDSGTLSDLLPLNVGRNTLIVKVTDNKGNETEYEITVTRAGSGSSGSNGGGSGGGTPAQPEDNSGIQTSVDDKDGGFATGTTTGTGAGAVTTAQVDRDKLLEKLAEGSGQKLKIHSPNEGDVKVDGLTAADLKAIADKGASLEIDNPLAIYPVPGGKMDLDGVSRQLGNAALNDIAVHIDIKRSSEALIGSANGKAQEKGYELLVPPVDLTLTFSNNGQTASAEQLNGYASKFIALPEGIDPNKITTGVIVNPDGSVFHVPTVVTRIDNRYYAWINDLRSSGSYSVIWNPQDFDDVKNHWGQADVNNIAARLSLAGNGDNTFSPDRNVTRSEFSEIVVLGLGLMRQNGPENSYPDVPTLAWYRTSVAIASQFDIVRGYNDGNFYGNRQITREQGFALVARALNLVNPQAAPSEARINELLAKYDDAANVAAWARADVAQLIAAGIVQGNGADTLKPKANMTRAEVTALIARLLKTTELIDK
ncbi:S-layer homology domain-containing protein [Cohnella cellulosilytica]|uniref:S-layer homology domain-containing protein n=1 Tax=Cohnella cellulosilytica TaxID=986710 RepID=A0ABW2FCA4_9BACL